VLTIEDYQSSSCSNQHPLSGEDEGNGIRERGHRQAAMIKEKGISDF
jgi:hypothetical protein